MRVALATRDGDFVAQHFGRAPSFLIADIDENTGVWSIVETRDNSPACTGDDAGHSSSAFAETLGIIADCGAVFAAQIGKYAQKVLTESGITPIVCSGVVDELLDDYAVYLIENNDALVIPFEEPIEVTKPVLPIAEHPCFSDDAKGRRGRLHLPVSAACNIQCRFCIRSCNTVEERPGVAQGVITPEEAVSTVARALELCPDLAVIGIAGPGDAFASPHAIETFRRVHSEYPEFIKCVSTNGLGLPGRAADLFEVGVRALTVTVNAVRPEITAQIVSRIVYKGRAITGVEAGEILIRNQLEGIREAAALGISVKVNTVLIPGVNDEHIAEIAQTVAEAGAERHNIIALIPQYEFADVPEPTCAQIEQARAQAARYIPQFLHCAHCRADACGVPGESDVSRELYSGRVLETFSHG
jgi:nitrogen fixation protein NifB